MSLSLRELLPEVNEKPMVKNAQGRIPAPLYDKAEAIMSKKGWNWTQVMRALFENFVHEFDEKAS